MNKIRLQKYLAKKGIDSRRKCEELIVNGRVKVNHQIVQKLGTKVDPIKDLVELDNIIIGEKVDKIYILLNKPKGYLCTYSDPFGRPTIYNLLEGVNTKVNYAGRLDYLSEGLVLLTNDGDLIYKITHPKKKIRKVYLVKINGIPKNEDIKKLEKGILLSPNLTTRSSLIKFIRKNKHTSVLKVTLWEGKKRQIRRMFSSIGFTVLQLKRIKIGILSLENLKSGHYRYLAKQEVEKLKNSI